MTEAPIRTKAFDFDARRDPKTNHFCAMCQKDMDPAKPYRTVRIIDGGATVLHPDDEARYRPDRDERPITGSIGSDCARRLGIEWTFAPQTTPSPTPTRKERPMTPPNETHAAAFDGAGAQTEMKFPNNLAAVMAERGLDVAMLRERTGLGEGTAYDLKNGKTQFSMDSLTRCAAALGVARGRLLPDGAGFMETTVPWNRLDPNPDNPRSAVTDDEALAALAESIHAQGVIVPLLVRPAGADGRHVVIAGARRMAAIGKLIGSGKQGPDYPVPVAIKADAEAFGSEAERRSRLVAALTENLGREDMNPVDEGLAFKTLHEPPFRDSAPAIARMIGKTPRHVQSRIALVRRLSGMAIAALRGGTIKLAQAEALMAAPDHAMQDKILTQVAEGELITEEQIRAAIQDLTPAEDPRQMSLIDPDKERAADDMAIEAGFKPSPARDERTLADDAAYEVMGEPGTDKAPWLMTHKEFAAWVAKIHPHTTGRAAASPQALVEGSAEWIVLNALRQQTVSDALADGHTVPPGILQDFPELTYDRAADPAAAEPETEDDDLPRAPAKPGVMLHFTPMKWWREWAYAGSLSKGIGMPLEIDIGNLDTGRATKYVRADLIPEYFRAARKAKATKRQEKLKKTAGKPVNALKASAGAKGDRTFKAPKKTPAKSTSKKKSPKKKAGRK